MKSEQGNIKNDHKLNNKKNYMHIKKLTKKSSNKLKPKLIKRENEIQ